MIWLLLVILLGCSGVVSASETALFALSRRVLRDFGRSTHLFRRRVVKLMLQPRRVLMTVLIANTAINVAIFAVSFVALRAPHTESPTLTAVGGVGVLTAVILFGEMLPKSIALSGAQRFAPLAGALIDLLMIVLLPLRWVLGVMLVDPLIRLLSPASKFGEVTTDDLRQLVEHSAEDGAISQQENAMLQAAVALHDIRVREIMTPRVDIESIGVSDSIVEVRRMFRATRRRTLPVRGDDLDDIRGMLHVRDGLTLAQPGIDSLIQPVQYVPEQIDLMQLIRTFREAKAQCVIVVDEYGGTAGMVSVNDLMETIVGDLPDPAAPQPPPVAEQLDRDSYRVSGDLSVRDWADRFGVDEVNRRVNTVAGLVAAKLGRLPRVGDSVRVRNLALIVEKMDRHRIERVLLRRDRAPTNAAEDGE